MGFHKITPPYIKDIASNSATYKRGYNYFINGHVDNLFFNRLENAVVADVYGTSRYDVELTLDEKGDVHFFCDCEAAWSYPGACKHTVATMFELHDRFDELFGRHVFGQNESSLLSQFKSFFEHYQETEEEKEILDVEYTLSLEHATGYGRPILNGVKLSIKLGMGRLYVVKGLDEFILTMEAGVP